MTIRITIQRHIKFLIRTSEMFRRIGSPFEAKKVSFSELDGVWTFGAHVKVLGPLLRCILVVYVGGDGWLHPGTVSGDGYARHASLAILLN